MRIALAGGSVPEAGGGGSLYMYIYIYIYYHYSRYYRFIYPYKLYIHIYKYTPMSLYALCILIYPGRRSGFQGGVFF